MIEKLIKEELENANRRNPLFQNNHEAYAVILEEVQETEEELKCVKKNLKEFWKLTREDVPIAISAGVIRAVAINLIEEAVQIAAMCEKAIVSEDRRNDE